MLGRIPAIRGGRLNDPRFGTRRRGEGIFADQISRIFHVACRKVGLPEDVAKFSLSINSLNAEQGTRIADAINR